MGAGRMQTQTGLAFTWSFSLLQVGRTARAKASQQKRHQFSLARAQGQALMFSLLKIHYCSQNFQIKVKLLRLAQEALE